MMSELSGDLLKAVLAIGEFFELHLELLMVFILL
jgi:hypothetical protein